MRINVTNPIKYTYIRNAGKTGRVITLARRWTDREAGKMEYSVAICNPKDVFTKKRAHQICEGRLRSWGGHSIDLVVGCDEHPAEAVLQHFAASPLGFFNGEPIAAAIAAMLYEQACRRLDNK